MKFILKKSTLTFYRMNVWFSVRLLRSYVNGIEEQIGISIQEYREQRALQLDEIQDNSFDDETGFPDIIETHRGLDSDDWDLSNIFENHFPSLQRRGALITLCSFLENELNGLCNLFRREHGLKIALGDLQGKGIERAMLFLIRVVELDIEKGTLWQEVMNIRELRNVVVHDNGKLKDREGRNKSLSKYVEKSSYLSYDDEIILERGYLEYVLDVFERQFQAVDRAITSSISGA